MEAKTHNNLLQSELQRPKAFYIVEHVIGMKTTKSTSFFNQNENKGKPSSKFRSWNKKHKKKWHVWNKNPIIFYCKEEMKTIQSYDKKMYRKLLLNKLKVMGSSTFIYTHWAPSSKKFFKLPIYMCLCSPILVHVHPCVAHVWTMSELRFN